MNYPGMVCLTPPTTEPITDTQLATQLRLGLDTSEYGLLAGYISAARMLFEEMTGRALMLQQWQATFTRGYQPFHEYEWWEYEPTANQTPQFKYRLPKSPVISISSITGIPPGQTSPIDLSDDYTLNNTVEPAVLTLNQRLDTLTVAYWCGYGGQLPMVSFTTDTWLSLAHTIVCTTDTLLQDAHGPTNTATVTTWQPTQVPAIMTQAITLLAASWYLHREQVIPTLGSTPDVPYGFQVIADLYRVRI